MKVREMVPFEVYAGGEGKLYEPRKARPMALVDRTAWVMEYFVPRRSLRRPVAGEVRNGELPGQAYPTAFKGLWVIEGTPELAESGALAWLARQASETLGRGPGVVPLLSEKVTSMVVFPEQLYLPWADHLKQLAAA